MKKAITLLLITAALAGCSNSSDTSSETPKEIILVSYDAFTPSKGIFDDFTATYGPTVKVVTAGDTG